LQLMKRTAYTLGTGRGGIKKERGKKEEEGETPNHQSFCNHL